MSNQFIKNVFILMLENHSFDNIFGFSGIPGINGVSEGKQSNPYPGNGKNYPVKKPAPDSMPSDPGHEFIDTYEQLTGKKSWVKNGTYPSAGDTINNSGFVTNYATSVTESVKPFAPAPPPIEDIGDVMLCFDTSRQLPATYELATQFAVCDNWFSSLPGPTWPNRFFAYAASSGSLDDSPSTSESAWWENVSGFSFPKGSAFELLGNHGLGYRLYQERYSLLSFPIVQALSGIHHWNMNDLSQFSSDLAKNYDYPFTLIEPNYGDFALGTYRGGSSQHPMDGMQNGEVLIKNVYEAIRNSPVWENSLLIITYDEHGGFYDHVAPPSATPPGDGASGYNKNGFNFDRLGVRVPAVVISPYIPPNTVSHTVFDHSSMIKTVEEIWNLPPLTRRDASANSLNSLLSLKKPRTDCPTHLSLAAEPGLEKTELTDEQLAQFQNTPLPESGNLIGFLQIAAKVEHELGTRTDEEKTMLQSNWKKIMTRGDARNYINSVLEKVRAERYS